MVRKYSLGEGCYGRGGIAWIEVVVPQTAQEFVVTQNIISQAHVVIARCPEGFKKAALDANPQRLPNVKFHLLQGYG